MLTGAHMQQHIIMLVAKKQAPRCQHLCALTLVYTFAVRVSPPLRWRLNVAEGPVLYVLPRPLTRVSPRSPPSCYLFDRVSSVAPPPPPHKSQTCPTSIHLHLSNTQTDTVRSLMSLLQPFKTATYPSYPRAQIPPTSPTPSPTLIAYVICRFSHLMIMAPCARLLVAECVRTCT